MGARGFVLPNDTCQLWWSARQCVRLGSELRGRQSSSVMWRNAFEVSALSPPDCLVVRGESGSGPNLALAIGGVELPCVSAELPAVAGSPGRRCR